MGYKRGSKVYNLTFEDFEGLEVRAKSMELGRFLDLIPLLDAGGFSKETLDKVFGDFSDVLLSWNVEEDDGTPTPTTVEGLYSLDLPEAIAIIEGWRDAIMGVAAPLEESSHDGELSPAVSIPMESLSENRAS